MPLRALKGIVAKISAAPRKIKRKTSSVLAPLNARERLVYSALLLSFISLLVAPRIIADVGDVGSVFSVAGTERKSNAGWLNPHMIAGQPSIGASSVRADITTSNASLWSGDVGAIECSGFSPITSHNRINNAVSITLRASNQPPDLNSISSAEAITKLGEGAVLNQRVDGRVALIEPNLLDQVSGELPSLDALLQLSLSTDNGTTWRPIHMFSKELVSTEQVRFEVSLPADLVEAPETLSFKVETVASHKDTTILVDSLVWTYEVGQSNEFSAKLIDPANGDVVTEEKPLLNQAEQLSFEIGIKNPGDGLLQGVANKATGSIGGSANDKVSVTSTLFDDANSIVATTTEDATYSSTNLDNESIWEISPSLFDSSLDPGSYTVELSIKDSEGFTQVFTQDFLWGVLALNSDKDHYQVGETAQWMITVLDEIGATVCDAKLTLNINGPGTNQTLSTPEGILISDTCTEYSAEIEADYFSAFQFSSAGAYDISLTAETQNGSYTANDHIAVSESPQFSVARKSATRILPTEKYLMEISLTSAVGFSGTFSDSLPSNFEISKLGNEKDYAYVETIDARISPTWQININPGETITLNYLYDAPDISPEFYLVGPGIYKDAAGASSYEEQRQWQIAGDAIGRMLLFWDGGAAPSGWTCVSCTGGDPFYQKLIRGSDTYGSTGGTTTHTHTASGSVDVTSTPEPARSRNPTPNELNNNSHTHTFSPSIGTASNLPNYRQLNVIRYNSTGTPATIPTGAIGLFDAAAPSGWTQYSAQNGYYIYGETTAGTTGGANTHSHAITGNTDAASGGLRQRNTTSTQNDVASIDHLHDASGSSPSSNNEPPYIETILAKLDSTAAAPNNLITMWDDTPPTEWLVKSESGGPFYQTFIKAASSYGATGGGTTNTHTDTSYSSGVASITTTSRAGGTPNASDSIHTHTVNVTGFSSDNHTPPYIDVIFAKKTAISTLAQSSYRWFANTDTTDVGTPLAAQDTVTYAPQTGIPFRLRMSVHVNDADRGINGAGLKLQYAQRSGSCDTSFIGESYADVETGSGALRYYDNAGPADSDALTTNANDPAHSAHTTRAQTYQEANNFTNAVSAISIGEDGFWDFALVDDSAAPSTAYCFRIVRATDDLLDTYSVVPEIVTDDGLGHMMLFWDGGAAPSGWTCVSCNPGDPLYQSFVRGEASFGASGGSPTHTHTADGSTDVSTQSGRSNVGSGLMRDHAHATSPDVASANNLPAYRQLRIIRANTSGTPGTIPAGAIAIFDAAVPGGWTRYATQDGSYIRGEDTVGSTGGSNTHTHTISGTTTAGDGVIRAPNPAGTQGPSAAEDHVHTYSGSSNSQSNEPPFINTILGKIGASSPVPSNMLAMWDGTIPGAWTSQSGSGGPFYQRFMKPAATYGGTGGTTTNTHGTANITSSGPTTTSDTRTGATNVSGDTHTHTVTVDNFSSENHLPPYVDVIIAKITGTNFAPSSPTGLDQIKVSTTSSISVGGWSDETQVRFDGNLSDPDNPDSLSLCVEVQEIGTPFTNTETSCGSAIAYSGTPVAASVTLFGLTNTAEYHWQARTKDGFGAYSAWTSFGLNLESARDFAIDDNDPAGNVYDGTTPSVDIDYNDGSLASLSANWDITDADSGISLFEYSIGSTPGGTDILGWTSNGTSLSVTNGSLTLQTSAVYYINVRSTDVAGNQVIQSADGILVSPTLSFSIAPTSVDFGTLDSGNGYTSTVNLTLTTSTNAYNGYSIRSFADSLLDNGLETLNMFNGGTYASPDGWIGGDTGFGYTSSDTLVNGSNLFNPVTCLGGNAGPCYAPFSLSAPGDIVADNTSIITGSPIVNEQFTITQRVTTLPSQNAGAYQSNIIYSITARY